MIEAEKFVTEEVADTLLNKLSARLGIPLNMEPGAFKVIRNRPSFSSTNIVEDCGPMKFALSEVRVASFNSEVYVDTDTGCTMWWVTVSFAYRLKEGGTNGCNFCTARWNATNDEWDLHFAETLKR